jgi:hypothetical protein
MRCEDAILGFVDLEWCLGMDTPEHRMSWLQMVRLKLQVAAEPFESDTVAKVSAGIIRPLVAGNMKKFIKDHVVSFKVTAVL